MTEPRTSKNLLDRLRKTAAYLTQFPEIAEGVAAIERQRAALQEWRDACHCGCDACVEMIETLGLESSTETTLVSGCCRSHPHENMNAECERLTEVSRATPEPRDG